jgi:hypothetical protein
MIRMIMLGQISLDLEIMTFKDHNLQKQRENLDLSQEVKIIKEVKLDQGPMR